MTTNLSKFDPNTEAKRNWFITSTLVSWRHTISAYNIYLEDKITSLTESCCTLLLSPLAFQIKIEDGFIWIRIAKRQPRRGSLKNRTAE
jgi:hypothetical protein